MKKSRRPSTEKMKKIPSRQWTSIPPTISILLLITFSTSICAAQTEKLESSLPELESDFNSFLVSQKLSVSPCEIGYEKHPATGKKPAGLQPHLYEMIKTCPASYNDSEMIEKCKTNFDSSLINDTIDIFLFAPLTSIKKNITYRNLYCGICHDESNLQTSFEYWTPWLSCRVKANESLSDKEPTISTYFADPIGESRLRNGLKKGKLGGGLISAFNDSIYECKISRVLPFHLKQHIRNCQYNFNPELSHMQSAKTVYRVTQEITKLVSAQNQSLQTRLKSRLMKPEINLSSELESFCEYKNQYGDICSTNLFYDRDTNSLCNSNGSFLIYSIDDDEGTWNECSDYTSKGRNYFYVCGPSDARLFKTIKRYIILGLDYISIFLLLLYLIISSNKRNLRNLPKLILYAYSITLFALYMNEYLSKYVDLCVIKYYSFFYCWQSHSFWILITSFDLWRIIYNSIKLRKVSTEGQMKRFIIYCSIGWGLPAIFLAALFPTLEDNQKAWICPYVFEFQNDLACSSSYEYNKYAGYFGWITIAIFLLVAPCLLLLVCLFVCLSKRNRARSSVNKSYVITMLKVAMIMGINWILLVYSVLFDSSDKFGIVYELITALHGSFVFFAFGLEKNNLDRLKRIPHLGALERTQFATFTQSSQENKSSSVLSKETSIDDVEK
ncbi:uncharacterized protein LOC135834703 [Planococcus citri]|uniref:uncharacterized protein LOC135834703 n=1 Tax=Planococcus citri TaxID=170843 RepID=UPI0031F910BA